MEHDVPVHNQNPHPALQQLRIRLQHIHDAISTYQPLSAKPPILDSSLELGTEGNEDSHWLQQENIQGLKKLRDSVKIDLDVLEKVWLHHFVINMHQIHFANPLVVSQ